MQQEALFAISNGLYVLSSCKEGNFSGSIVDAVSQISAEPPLIMVSCMNTSHTKECIGQTGEFALSVLSKDTAPSVIANFGYQSGKNVNKWEHADKVIIGGLPYIPNALAKIRAKVKNKLIYPNNTIFIAEVTDAFDVRAGEPLTYKNYRDGFKGECLKAFAPSSQNKEENLSKEVFPAAQENKENKKRWTCTLCNYVYDGDIPFEDLPADWRCPLCGVGKELFELR